MPARLAPSDVLRVWEWGRNRHAVDRALVVLAAAEPQMDHEDLAALPVGQRDRLLLVVRDATFGPRLRAVSSCPACASELEMEVTSRDLRADPDGASPAPEVEVEGYRLRLRPLDSRDLAAAARAPDVPAARRVLLERAVARAEHAGQAVQPGALPAPVLDSLPALLAELDPQADLMLELRCPACDHEWVAPLDVAGFFWAEIAAHAWRLLREVDALARAYGWREGDVLGLSHARRQAYLELVGAG